jgi:hypothetical protein
LQGLISLPLGEADGTGAVDGGTDAATVVVIFMHLGQALFCFAHLYPVSQSLLVVHSGSRHAALLAIFKEMFLFDTTAVPANTVTIKKPMAIKLRGSMKPFMNFEAYFFVTSIL